MTTEQKLHEIKLHIETLKKFHKDFDFNTDSSYIIGVLDGFFSGVDGVLEDERKNNNQS